MPDEKILSLQDLSEKRLAEVLSGYPTFRAQQVYLAAMQYKKYSQMTNLPKDIIAFLAENYDDVAVRIQKVFEGKDGTEKYLFLLRDGNMIEGVFMPHGYGNTICISTQVGCRMGCAFCASTLNGLVRNLTAGEMLGQVLAVNVRHGGTLKKRAITNIVLMGSGEPLDNYEEVTEFLRLVSAENGINISLRNISLSTCGLVDKMKALADSGLSVTLTVSLHAPTDEIREKIMPVDKKYKIAEVLDAARYYFAKTGRRVVIEYSLIDGVNSRVGDAKKLARLLHGFSCHVNLINLNKVEERKLNGVDKRTVDAFMAALTEGGISNTLRRSMGNDIGGACGQLRRKFVGEEGTY